MTARIATALTALVLAASLTGCAKLEKAFTPAPKVVTEEATVAVAGAKITGDTGKMPKDLPLWPGASVESADSMKSTYTLVVTTSDPYDDVLNGVAVGLQRAGWDVAEETSGEEGGRVAVLTVSTDGQTGFVTIAEGDGANTIEYVLEPAP